MVFPVVMYGYESWTIKKAEHWRIDAFELWCWRRLLIKYLSSYSFKREGFGSIVYFTKTETLLYTSLHTLPFFSLIYPGNPSESVSIDPAHSLSWLPNIPWYVWTLGTQLFVHQETVARSPVFGHYTCVSLDAIVLHPPPRTVFT